MAKLIEIAAFPLPIVVFPEEEVRLHIFELRYQQLIKDCLDHGIVFGILPVINNSIKRVGAIMRLVEVSKTYPDGRMDVRLSCINIFISHAFNERFPGKLYSSTQAEYIDYDTKPQQISYDKIRELFMELCRINNVKPYYSIDWNKFISYKLAHYVGFTLEQEYEFSSIFDEKNRTLKIEEQLSYMIEQSKLRLNWITRLNMNGEYLQTK